MKKIILILILTLILGACKSPMDLDGPTIIPLVKGRIYPNLTTMTTEENDTAKNYIVHDVYAQIDTFGQVPVIWLKINLDATSDTSQFSGRITINHLGLYLDSVPINGLPVQIWGDTVNDVIPWLRFRLQRSPDGTKDTTIFCGSGRNYSDVSFAFDKDKREVWAFMYSKIYADKILYETHDTILYDGTFPIHTTYKIPIIEKDSLLFNGRFKFKY